MRNIIAGRSKAKGAAIFLLKHLILSLLLFSSFLVARVSFAEAPLNRCSNATSIAAGVYHTVGLKADGTVVAVGDNSSGQLNVSSWTNIKAIAAGYQYTVGLKADGSVVAVGDNSAGQLNVSSWKNIKAIAAGDYHLVGLKADGTVVAVGDNSNGQLNVSTWTSIKTIAAGGNKTVGVKEDGTVVVVGESNCQVSTWTNIKAVAVGFNDTAGLKENGTVVLSESYNDVSTWVDIKAIAAGVDYDRYVVGLKQDGSVVAVGDHSYGQLDVSSWTDIIAIEAGGYHTVGLRQDGSVVAVGDDSYGQLDVSSWTITTECQALIALPTNLQAAAASSSQINLSWIDNAVNEEGYEVERKIGTDASYLKVATLPVNTTSYSDAGLTPNTTYTYRVRAYNTIDNAYSNEATATCPTTSPNAPSGLAASGITYSRVDLAWTDNANNESSFVIERSDSTGAYVHVASVGQNVTTYSDTTVIPSTSYSYRIKSSNIVADSSYSNVLSVTTSVTCSDVATIAAGFVHTVGLKEDGTVLAVGRNLYGESNVSTWTNIKAIAAGSIHTVGLKEDGTAVAVGLNNYCQLNVSRWTNIKASEAGYLHTVGLKEDGTVVAVGSNLYGELNVSAWKNIKAITAGGYYTVGLKEDGTVLAVGRNLYGELNVSTWMNIKAIAASALHTAGLIENGTVVAVGDNRSGQLNVSSWRDIKAIAAGYSHTIGLKDDGTVVAVGDNYYGQLNVSSWKNIKAIAAGSYYTVGLKEDGTVVAVGEMGYGETDVSAWTNIMPVCRATDTITPQTGANGSISPDIAQLVNRNSGVSFSVTPDPGYHIASVNGCGGTLAGNTYTTGPIIADCTVSATFEINKYTVTPSPGPNGSISPGTAQLVNHNSVASFSITPDPGYHVASVIGCGGTLAGNTYTTGPVTADCAVSATFGMNPPSHLTATLLPAARVRLTWTDNSINESSFIIERKTGLGGIYTQVALMPADTTTFIDMGLAPDTRYYYRIRATSIDGSSVNSQETSVATLPQQPLAAGGWHAFYLRADGLLAGWGHNEWFGQVGDGTWVNRVVPVPIAADTPWAAIAAGTWQSVGLKSDHSLWSWGESCILSNIPVQVGSNSDWVAITADGAYGIVALKADGTLWAWGSNCDQPVQIGLGKNWVAMSGGGNTYTLAINSDGTLWKWKYVYPQTPTEPSPVGSLNTWISVSMGNSKGIALKEDGTVWTLGNNDSEHIQVGTDTTWVAIDAGIDHFAGLKSDGTLWTWGENNYGQLGDGSTISRSAPVQVGTDTDWVAVSAGASFTIAMKSDRTVWAWGKNDYGQLADGTTINKTSPIRPFISSTMPAQPGDPNAAALSSSTIKLTWIDSSNEENSFKIARKVGEFGTYTQIAVLPPNSTSYLNTALTPGVTYYYQVRAVNMNGDSASSIEVNATTHERSGQIAAGGNHTLYLREDGLLLAWGYNAYGQLGDGSTENRTMPVRINESKLWTGVAAGYNYSAAIDQIFALWSWGSNNGGQLGDDSTTQRNTPVRIGNDAWSWIAPAKYSRPYTMGLKSDGTLWGWGLNSAGQLGDGTTTQRTSPGPSGTDNDWVTVAAGGTHTVAIKYDGSLWAWGSNTLGQLGDGTTTSQTAPVQITRHTDYVWVSVSAGASHSVGLRSDGTLWAWGSNYYGQLGDGTTTNQNVPVQVGTDTTWFAVAAGVSHTIALKSDGTLWAWGSNSAGQLGDGTTTNSNVPIHIGQDKTWTAVSAGGSHSAAIASDGGVWAWGANNYGQLGDGTTVNKTAVVRVATAAMATIRINDGASLSNSTSVMLSINPLPGFTLSTMQFSNDNTTWSAAEPFQPTKNWMVGLGDGIKTVYAAFRDAAGVQSMAASTDTILLDATVPTGSVSINNGAEYTKTITVSLALSAQDSNGITQMMFSNNGNDWSDPESFATTKAWTMTTGDGTKTVYVRFRDAAGNWSTPYSSSIIVDTVAPTVSITSPSAALTNNPTQTLSYTASDGTLIVKVDGVTVSQRSGDTISFSHGSHTIRVEATDTAGNTGSAQVTFTVDIIAPTVSIASPIAGVTNNSMVPLSYSVSDGTVVVKVDGNQVSNVSGDTLSLQNGTHNVRVESTDTAGNLGFAQVDFTVDTTAAGNDDTNIYCKGTGTYLVGPSNFTSGITPPTGSNEVWIASPSNGATVNGPRIIVKGAMDTTIPVNMVSVLVTTATGSASYPAQVNGKYFAAQVPVTSDVTTISAIATDQTGTQHQASVSVTVTEQPDNLTLNASPSTGITTLKQNGLTTLDVSLMSIPTITAPIASYAWDFKGSGSNDVTCYSHSDVVASYQQTGLYLTKVTITDTGGKTYTDTAIVNAVEPTELKNILQATWNRVKTALLAGDIETSLIEVMDSKKDIYRTMFTQLGINNIQSLLETSTDFEVENFNGNTAECGIIREESDGVYSYPIGFAKDANGIWKIRGF